MSGATTATTNRAYMAVPDASGGRLELRELPVPAPGEGELRVRVHAAGVNHGDLVLRSGNRDTRDPRFPASGEVPAGVEVAGTVDELGAGVEGWQVGERVMGRCIGGYADFATVPGPIAMRVPEGLSWLEAAVLPVSYVVAHDALVTAGGFRRGETVFVNAASSGVGTATVQLAALFGAERVIGMSSDPAKLGRLEELGLTESHVADYTQTPDGEAAPLGEDTVDVLIDLVGGATLPANIPRLALRGRLVTVGRLGGNTGACDLDLIALKRARIVGVTNRTRTVEERARCVASFLDDVSPHVADGSFRPAVARVFPFEEAMAAQDYLASRQQVGKVVIQVREEGE